MPASLGPGDIVLDGEPAPVPKKRAQQPPLFGPCLLWPNGSMDQDATWYGGGPWPRPHCVRWGTISPKPGTAPPPIFGSCLLWPNGWMDQDAIWYGGKPGSRPICVRLGPASPKKGTLPHFSANVYCGLCGQTVANLSYCSALVTYPTGKL